MPQLILPEVSWHTCTERGLLVDSRANQVSSEDRDQPSHERRRTLRTWVPTEHCVNLTTSGSVSTHRLLPHRSYLWVSGSSSSSSTFPNCWFSHLTLAKSSHTALLQALLLPLGSKGGRSHLSGAPRHCSHIWDVSTLIL